MPQATAAIIKIDPLDQLLICNATRRIREAYFSRYAKNHLKEKRNRTRYG